MLVGNLAANRVDIADFRFEALEAPCDFDANATEAKYASAHASELAPQRQTFLSPAAGAHETVGPRDLTAAGEREGDRKIGDIVEKHRGRRQDDSTFADGRQIAGFQADAIEGADLQLRHQLQMALRQPGHAMPHSAANIRADFSQGGERIRLGVDRMNDEAPLELLEYERLLRADQRQFDIRK